MLQKQFKILFAICSLLTLSSCNDAPAVDVCVSDPAMNGFVCIAKDQKTQYFLAYADSTGLIGVKGNDFEAFLNWVKRNKK